MVSQSIVIRAPIETVYQTITDFESYPDFLPEIKGAKVDWCGDAQMDVSFRLELIKEIPYCLRFTLNPPSEVSWVLKQGEIMRTNTGGWKLKALEDSVTDATYSLEVTFGLWVPKAVTETLVKKSLPQTLKRFKKRAEGKFRKEYKL